MTQKTRVALIMGTRPEVIKMMPVHRELRKLPQFETLLISTGQQREMSQQAFESFGASPDVKLDVMTPNQDLPSLTSRLIIAISDCLGTCAPDIVLVHGDTTTTLAAGLASFYRKIALGHVEAGLRTYNFAAPWPEEMNRRLVDPLCTWCFAPTALSRKNLLAERIPEERIFVTGNTVIDALMETRLKLTSAGFDAATAAKAKHVPSAFIERFCKEGAPGTLILVTGHRRESFGEAFEALCRGILGVADRFPNVGIMYPVHLNPNVLAPVRRILGGHDRICLTSPVSYEEFIALMARSHFILTDSGGVQEEAPSLGKPVLVMRETTERPEGIESGTCKLVGTDEERIIAECSKLLNDPDDYSRRSVLRNPFGDGTAASKIARTLSQWEKCKT
jgi:UDP-N-acetylglucosamine 2-epimerase (non-hydrolysing)